MSDEHSHCYAEPLQPRVNSACAVHRCEHAAWIRTCIVVGGRQCFFLRAWLPWVPTSPWQCLRRGIAEHNAFFVAFRSLEATVYADWSICVCIH